MAEVHPGHMLMDPKEEEEEEEAVLRLDYLPEMLWVISPSYVTGKCRFVYH
jgi:hypothetical protein